MLLCNLFWKGVPNPDRNPPNFNTLSCLSSVASAKEDPRLTAPNRGKTRLNAPNRAKNFSGGSRACIRGSTKKEIAGMARSCGKKIIIFHGFRVLSASVVKFIHIGKSSRLKVNKAKYSPGKPSNLNTSQRALSFSPLLQCSALEVGCSMFRRTFPSVLLCAIQRYSAIFSPIFYSGSALSAAFVLSSEIRNPKSEIANTETLTPLRELHALLDEGHSSSERETLIFV